MAPEPSRILELLRAEFDCWTANPRYLSLDWDLYSPECPPLLVIGGASLPLDARPLVVVSIEPLLAANFQAQVRFAAATIDQYVRWNREYFEIFPGLVGNVVQPYWRNMVEFVAGWGGVNADATSPWSSFGKSIIELPYIPMHSKKHRPGASAAASEALRSLFLQRVDAVLDCWPGATFVVLASAVRRRLEKARLVGALAPIDLDMSISERELFGSAFATRVARGRLATATEPLVFVRNAPFARRWNPRRRGRYELGQRLRLLADESVDSIGGAAPDRRIVPTNRSGGSRR